MKQKFYQIKVTITKEMLKDILVYREIASTTRPIDLISHGLRQVKNDVKVTDAMNAVIERRKNIPISEMLKVSDIEVVDEFNNDYV